MIDHDDLDHRQTEPRPGGEIAGVHEETAVADECYDGTLRLGELGTHGGAEGEAHRRKTVGNEIAARPVSLPCL